MPKRTRKIEAKRQSLFLPEQAMNARPQCSVCRPEAPMSHWIVSKGTLVPCSVTMP